MSCKLCFLLILIPCFYFQSTMAMNSAFLRGRDPSAMRPFLRPKCGRRLLQWMHKKYKDTFPTKFLIQAPLNPRYARKYNVTPGCKFPFHDGMYQCCRLKRGDCTESTISKMVKVNRELNRCIREDHLGVHKCWVVAEKSQACKKSYYSNSRNMKKFNNGHVW